MILFLSPTAGLICLSSSDRDWTPRDDFVGSLPLYFFFVLPCLLVHPSVFSLIAWLLVLLSLLYLFSFLTLQPYKLTLPSTQGRLLLPP